MQAPMLNVASHRIPLAPPRDYDVALPSGLANYGTSVRARAVGTGSAVVVLGGISATHLVCPDVYGRGGWWPGVVGAGDAIDPAASTILGVDFAADESGAAAPTTAEQACVVLAAMDSAGIDRAGFLGASYGGMVALSLAAMAPERVARIVVISAGPAPHPMATAIRSLQRRIVSLGMETGRGADALAIARGLAMVSYRTAQEFGERFEGGIASSDPLGGSEPGAYLRARGDDFVNRMSPGRFLSLSASIDRHRVDPARITAPALLIGAESDQLVPPSQMQALAGALGGPAELRILASRYGHDMFLKETAAMNALVAPFLRGEA